MSLLSAHPNLRWFLLFRVFFNARFYYPVFTILFLDYGLTLEQFAILNVVWAITIVIAEVPSGALADLIGRRNLIVFAAILMVIELSIVAFVPIGASSLLFMAFLINRVCSGLAEAAASGADEALAYDSLKSVGREKEWPKLLEQVGRATSIAFFTTMLTGALAYDHEVLNRLLSMVHLSIEKEFAIRLPIIFTMATSTIVLLSAIRLREVSPEPEEAQREELTIRERILRPFRQILEAARWTLHHRWVLFILLACLALDSVARQLIILASEYYRMIGIPTAGFGIIGAASALMGVVYARVGRLLVERQSAPNNFLILAAILLTGLIGVRFLVPYVGILFAMMCFSMLPLVMLFSSSYLNESVSSRMRATVLSFRGLAFNLALGIASLLYSGWIRFLEVSDSGDLAKAADSTPDFDRKDILFATSLNAFPFYFLALATALIVAWHFFKPKDYPDPRGNRDA